MKKIDEVEIENKKIILRASLDLPMENGVVTDNARLKDAQKTINYLIEKNCKIIIIGHLGRPKGRDENLSLRPVANELAKLLNREVQLSKDCVGDNVTWEIKALTEGDILMLENLRFNEGEEKNDPDFGLKLSSYADFYVNEAFSNCHRKHASMVGIPSHIPGIIGFNLANELIQLSKIQKPVHPYTVIIGGAKKDKMKSVEGFLKLADHVIVGGVLANTFLKAAGFEIAESKYDPESIELAKELIQKYKEKLITPVDVLMGDKFSSDAKTKVFSTLKMPQKGMIMDIGPETIKRYSDIISKSNSIFWGGPIGVFEWEKFSTGTKQILHAVANSKAFSVMGGGDSEAAANKFGLASRMGFVSKAGGASLRFIEGKEMPALLALDESEKIFFH